MAQPAILPSAYTAFPHVPHSRSVLENHASFSSAPAPFAAARVAAGASNSQYTHERTAGGSSARLSSVRSTARVIRRPTPTSVQSGRYSARNVPIRPIASVKSSARGRVTMRRWSGWGQLKPLPCTTSTCWSRSRSSTNC